MKFHNSKYYSISWVLFFAFFAFSKMYGQEVKVSASIEKNSIVIGQQTALSLKIQFNDLKQAKVSFPELVDTIRKEIEVVAQSKVDTLISDKGPFRFTLSKNIYITSFDSGYWAIPPIKFNVNNSDTNFLYSDPLLLEVNTVAVDTTQEIKDIKAPYGEEYTWIDWLKDNMYVVYGAIIIVLVIIVIILIIRYFRKIPPPMVVVDVPKIPAHIIAMEKIEKLKLEKLWQEGKLKQYHSSLTDILREYIENRFKIPALEQTTEEILFGFRNIAVDQDSAEKLRRVLVLADLVKFAKEHPLPNENESSLNNVIDFINGTKKEEEQIKK